MLMVISPAKTLDFDTPPPLINTLNRIFWITAPS